MTVTCRFLDATEVLPLRSEVLRPGWSVEDCVYSRDREPGTFHAGAVDADGRVIGIVSFHVEPYAGQPSVPALRFQGMAVAPERQGNGVGSQLLKWALQEARQRGDCQLVWCNARTPALSFYRRLGFQPVGEEFMTDWGPHYLMFKPLAT